MRYTDCVNILSGNYIFNKRQICMLYGTIQNYLLVGSANIATTALPEFQQITPIGEVNNSIFQFNSFYWRH